MANQMITSPASSITKAAGKQTYYTIRFFVNRERVDDAYRAYGYFRWVDNVLDADSGSGSERRAFLERQKSLLEKCYRGESPRDANIQEKTLVELVQHDHEKNSGLQSYLRNMMLVIDFDARRRGRLISQVELNEYTRWLASAVTETMHYFIGHGFFAPQDETRYLAVSAAHITHMLRRDTFDDVQAGYYNIPLQVLEANHIGPQDVQSDAYRTWVKSRVQLAREYFRAGKVYLARVQNPRCRLAGFAYTARFEWLLDTMEREAYRLRPQYNERKSVGTGMKTKSVIVIGAGIGGITAATHLARRGLHVTVVEKNSRPGGRCDRLSREGHHFDTGPTLLVMPLLYERIIPSYGEEFLRREGLKPEIAAWEDGLRADTGPGTFEWWYFDAHLDDGSTAVMIYATKPLILRGDSLTPMVALTITRPDRVRLSAPPLLYPPSQFEAARAGCQVHIGPSRVSGNLHSYELHTEGDKDWAADLVFTASAPPWRPGAGKSYYDEALSRYFGWLVPIPYGKVEGTLTYDGKTHPVCGSGFQDHPSGKRYPLSLDFHWKADKGTVHVTLRQPHLIHSFSLLDDFPGWKRWLARRFVNPYYFRFDAEIELNVDLAETKAVERGSAIYELMVLR